MNNLSPEIRKLFVSDLGFVADYLNEGSFEGRRGQKIIHPEALCDMIFEGSVMKNIWLGNLEAGDNEVLRIMGRLNISHLADRRIIYYEKSLSGGEKQRISMARALLSLRRGELYMNTKIKILSIGNKKVKPKDAQNWNNLIEEYAPGLYENYNAAGEKEAMELVTQLRPEIIMLSNKLRNALEVLAKVKQIHPAGAVFVVLADMVDDEQQAMDEFKAHGAYKCYPSPLSMDTLTHDMYVALNIE